MAADVRESTRQLARDVFTRGLASTSHARFGAVPQPRPHQVRIQLLTSPCALVTSVCALSSMGGRGFRRMVAMRVDSRRSLGGAHQAARTRPRRAWVTSPGRGRWRMDGCPRAAPRAGCACHGMPSYSAPADAGHVQPRDHSALSTTPTPTRPRVHLSCVVARCLRPCAPRVETRSLRPCPVCSRPSTGMAARRRPSTTCCRSVWWLEAGPLPAWLGRLKRAGDLKVHTEEGWV